MDVKPISPSFQRKKDDAHIKSPLKKDDCNIQYGGVSKNEDDDAQLIDTGDRIESKCTKLYGILTTLTIEPVLFTFMLAFFINMCNLTNMMMDKGCLFHMNYSTEICNNLSHHKSEKNEVEILANNYALYSNLTSFIGAFMMTFIAPWSDKYGRRLPLLLAVAGAVLADIGILLCTIYFESRLEYLILSRLPMEMTGGFICTLAIVFSHASETSSEKNRTLKYTSLEIALGLGMAFGMLTGGFLYRYYGYLYVYSTVTVLHVLCFLWTLFIVEETRGLDVNVKWSKKIKDFFSCQSFKSGIATTCRAREGNHRPLILLLMISMCMIVLNYEAFATISFVYVHHVYDWDPSNFSIVNTTASLAGLALTLLLVPVLIRVFKFRDFTLGIIGVLSMMAKNLCIAFSKYHVLVYYIGLAFGVFTGLSTLAVRTGLSKVVKKDEIGQVFAFLATCEAIIPVIGTIAVTQIFNSTIDIFPNVTYTIGAVLLLVALATFIWALKTEKNPYSALSVSANDHTREKA